MPEEPMPPTTLPPISVVICTRDRPQDVALCLPTVLGNDYPDFEVVLVDQSAGDGTEACARTLAAAHPHLRYHRTGTVGKSAALNLGIGLARHPLLCFTDDDCEAPPGWLAAVAGAAAADPAADVLFGPVLPSPSLAGRDDICVPSWVFTEDRRLRPAEVSGMGANMALRARALGRLPGGAAYDEVLGPGAAFPAAEEGDFVYRLRRAGAVAALKPSLALYHRAYRTPAHWGTVLFGYGVGDAAFYLKHVRCGDLRALAALAGKLLDAAARTLVRAARRRPDGGHYLRGLCAGLQQSRRLPVDRATRLYRVPPSPAPAAAPVGAGSAGAAR